MPLKIETVLDNAELKRGLEQTKSAFDELATYIKKKDFGEAFQKQIGDVSKQIGEMIKTTEQGINDVQAKIDDLIAKRNQATASGDGQSAGQFQYMIDGLVKERAELLKNLSHYQTYKDKLIEIAGTADDFLEKQEKKRAAVAKFGAAIKTGAVGGMKALIAATKAFVNIGLVAIVSAISSAFMGLLNWIKGTEAGQMALAKASGYLSGIFTSLKKVAAEVGKTLLEAFKVVKPVLEAVVNRAVALVSVYASLIKMVGHVTKKDWDGVKGDFEDMKASLKSVWSGQLTGASEETEKAAKSTAKLYAERQKLQNSEKKWAETKSKLELKIAEAEAKGDQAKVKALNDKIYKQELAYLEAEYEVERALVDLKGEAATISDQDNLRDLRIAINEKKAANIKSDAKSDAKSESAASKAKKEQERLEREAERLARKEEQLQNELNAMLLENEEARLDLMDEGTKKEVQSIKQKYDKRAEELRKQEAKWKRLNEEVGRAGLGEDGLTDSQRAALNAARAANEASTEKAQSEIARRNREQYLKEYGTYQEKKLAINEEYMRKWLATEDEYERKSLAKEREANLKALEKQYSSSYALMFADASMLSDNLLAQAIKATQEEIDKATKDGKVEELESLYKRLREQMEVQTDRNGSWGFVGIGKAYTDLEKAREGLEKAIAIGDKSDVVEATSEYEKAMANVQKRAEQVQTAFSEIGSIMEGMGGTIGEIGSGISSLGGAAKGIMDIFAQEKAGQSFNKGDSIVSVFQSAIELAGMLVNSIKANKEAQEDWNRTMRQSEHELAMLNLEALDYKEQNIFGIENPYKKAIDGAKQYSEAMKALQEQTAKLVEGGKVQTGTKKAINWSNVGKGAAIGAAAGAVAGAGIFSGITTAAGAAIGAAAGIITGLLSTKVVPVFKTLQEKYGTVVNDALELNPQIIADYDKLDEDTKKLVDNWKEIKAKAEEAEAQMRETFKNLAGDIGNQLSDSLVEAFKNGKLDSAIDDFHDKMNDTIEDIIEQMIFSNVFSEMFDNLQKEMEESFKGPNADENIVDDLIRFEEAYKNGLEEYEKQMEDARAYMQSAGFKDAFTNDTQRAGLSQGVATASQDSIDALSGMMTVVQGHTFEIKESLTGFSAQYETLIANTAAMLEHTQGIHVDTTEIKEIQAQIAELSRSINSNVSTIVDRGVTMRG